MNRTLSRSGYCISRGALAPGSKTGYLILGDHSNLHRRIVHPSRKNLRSPYARSPPVADDASKPYQAQDRFTRRGQPLRGFRMLADA
jgi:hypothetical protein